MGMTGKFLKEVRIDKKIKIKQVANHLGVSTHLVLKIEKGITGMQEKYLEAWSDLFGLDPEIIGSMYLLEKFENHKHIPGYNGAIRHAYRNLYKNV